MDLVPAADLHGFSLTLPETVSRYLQVISSLESGYITLIQSDNLKRIHQLLHEIMVHASLNNIAVKLVDSSNCFNPHLITKLVFEIPGMPVNATSVLNNIQLSRPFQVLQAVDIIRNLEQIMLGQEQQLIIMTDISKHFFDPQVAQQDPEYPASQVDALRAAMGKIKALSLNNNIVVITDRIDRDEIEDQMKFRLLSSVAKIRVQVQEENLRITSTLANHPYRSPMVKVSEIQTNTQYQPHHTALNNFFGEGSGPQPPAAIVTLPTRKRKESLDQFF